MNPTIYYWLDMEISKLIKPSQLSKEKLNNFNTIILVRYIPLRIIIDLFRLRKKLKIVLLIDVNLLDFNIFSELPFLYKIKIFFGIYCYKLFLHFFIDEIWVTNERLEKKIKKNVLKKDMNIKLLSFNNNRIYNPKKIFKIAYIGTSSHQLELYWLKSLFEQIQFEREDILIEIYLDKKWRRLYRHIPRVSILYPTNWETFHMNTLLSNVDVVLNPIINSNFNKYRSPTKFFDTTRLGAVGIYSNCAPFKNFIKDYKDGILLENDIEIWKKEIYHILNNVEARQVIYLNASKRANNLLK